MKKKILKIFCLLLIALTALQLTQQARADYVGEIETTKYFDQTTVNLITTRLSQGTGLLAGDQVSYYIQFTPTNNGGYIGGGSFITDYVPSGMQVIDAAFVQLNSDGSYTKIAPPLPAEVYPAQVPLYSDTGIFYSTDSRTAMYTSPLSTIMTSANGYALPSNGCNGVSLPSTSHNAWDTAMETKFSNPSMNNSGTCAAGPSSAVTYSNYGLSPVAGPDAYLTVDSTGAVGPWHRISYTGSMKGTALGTSGYGGCVGGTATLAGYTLSATNPLPINTNAVRFAAGKVTVGELFVVRISFVLTANMPASGIINNAEVFGGDASRDAGSGATYGGDFPHWRYFCPAVTTANSTLTLLKTLVGQCSGSASCVPVALNAGVVPSAANLKLRYQVEYLNTGSTAQTNVILTDALASGGTYVSGSASQVSVVPSSTSAIGTPTGTTTLTFPTISSLASGAGGTVQYDVLFASAPAEGTALINDAKLVSSQLTTGVTSKAIATTSTKANLWIGKSIGTSTTAPGNTVSYTITIPNNGGGSATSVVVNDYLPSAGGSTVTNRFAYLSLTSASITTSAGVVTAVTPTVTHGSVATLSPYTGLNREQVTFTLPTATAIPSAGKLTITFTAQVGSNVSASATPYLNDANVTYAGGPGGTGATNNISETIGSAPVTVLAPMALTVKLNCVYAGTSCITYTNGTIAPGSKIQYRLDFSNISASALTSVILTDTLPTNTTFVTGSASNSGSAVTPTVSGQVLTFPTIPTLAASPSSGYITFDVQLCTAVGTGCTAIVSSGTDITDSAMITASSFTAGVTANVTISVQNQANLQISKTASPSTIQVGGAVTYTLTVTNTGNAAASGIQLYDELPYSGSTSNAALRFNYGTAGTFTLNDTVTAAANQLVSVTPTLSIPPTFTGYTVQTNRQEIYWNFGAAKQLAAGASFVLTYSATAGSSLQASATPYTSNIVAQYISATNTMYASASNTAQVTIGGLDHYELSLPASSIACLPTTATLTACADTSSPCANTYQAASGQTATLSTNGGTLGATTVTFGSTGVATTTLSYPAAANGTAVSVTLSSAQAAVSNPTKCCPNGVSCTVASNCSTTFNTSGFIFSSSTGGSVATLPTQTAGTSSGTYYLRAVQTNTTTMACQTGLAGTQSVNLGYECINPATCYTTNLMNVNGGSATTIARNNSGNVTGYSAVSMTFDANGNAPFSFIYSDAGQVRMWVNTTVNSATLAGSSNAFVSKPGRFVVSGIKQTASPYLANPGATDATGAKFVKAGESFSVTVTATTSSGATTPNFGKETSPEGVKLTSTLIAPSGGNNPAVSGTFGAFINGIATADGITLLSDGVTKSTPFSWNEVGIITLTPTLLSGNYLGLDTTNSGLGNVAGTSSGNIGRFYLAKFALVTGATIANRVDLAACASSGCGAYSYMGEQFNAIFSLTAQALGGSTTQNYTYSATAASNFAKLNPSATGNPLGLGAVDNASTRTPLTSRLDTSLAASGSFVNGSASIIAPLAISRGSTPDGPYVSLDIGVAPQDSDGALMATYDLDTINVVSATPDHTKVARTGAGYGRMKITNATGSELLALPFSLSAQYWNGSDFVNTSNIDSNSVLLLSNIVLGNYHRKSGDTWTVSVSLLNGTAINGIWAATLSKPGGTFSGKGSVDITSNAPNYLPATMGRATFGAFKGNKKFIFMKENY